MAKILLCFWFFVRLTNAQLPNDLPEFEYMDLSADPCHNFYKYTCGKFVGEENRDQFVLLENQLLKIGQEILTSCRNESEAFWKAKQAYHACLTSDQENPELVTIEDVGGFPLISTSNETVQFSWPEIGDLVGKYGVPLLFSITVEQIDQQQTVIRIGTNYLDPSLFRPKFGHSYVEMLEKKFKESAKRRVSRTAIDPFVIFLQTLTKKLLRNSTKSEDQILDEIDNVVIFMSRLHDEERWYPNIIALDKKTTLGKLQKWTYTQFDGNVQLNWTDYLTRVFQLSGVPINDGTLIIHTGTHMLFTILNVVHQTDASIVKNFALLRIFLFQAPDSDQTARQASEDYYTAQDIKILPREDYCTLKVLDRSDTPGLSFAAAYVYHNKLRNMHKVQAMVDNIRNVLIEELNTLTWMDVESRLAALNKVDDMLTLLGFPDFVRNVTLLDSFYANLEITQSNYENARHLRAFKQAYLQSQLGQHDRHFWIVSPFLSNAYYLPSSNRIVIPIALMNPSLSSTPTHFNPIFFSGDNDVLDNSRLGTVIGHEIAHGVTEQDLWSERTKSAFSEKRNCFSKQYQNYQNYNNDYEYSGDDGFDNNDDDNEDHDDDDEEYLIGNPQLSEILADYGGLSLAYKAFKEITSNIDSGTEKRFKLDQQFFIGFGTMWCSSESNDLRDEHAPSSFRVVGTLANMPEFAEAFNCPTGSRMNPEKKCSLW